MGGRRVKQNPIRHEAIQHLYAYSAIKGALLSGTDEGTEREENADKTINKRAN
jgi:hypothetical protein